MPRRKVKNQSRDDETIEAFAGYSDDDLRYIERKLSEEVAELRGPIATLLKKALKLIQMQQFLGSEIARRGLAPAAEEEAGQSSIAEAIAFAKKVKGEGA